MKVLQNNYFEKDSQNEFNEIEPYPRKLVCEHCNSELEYDKSDLRIGALGCVHLDCPCCGKSNAIDSHEDELILTVNNIEFPTHFWHTSKENGAVDCCNNERIREYIRNAIDYFRTNKDKYTWYTYIGNCFIAVFRYDGDKNYEIIVSDSYYSTYIPFESKDYAK